MRLLSSFLIFLLFLVPSERAFGKKTKEAPAKKTPIVVTAKEMEAHSKEGWLLFQGNVKAVHQDMTVYADKIKVLLTPKGKVEKIVALGHVRVEKGKRVVLSERAEYRMGEDIVEFTGHPKAWEGNNLVVGEKMLYYPKENKSVVVGGKERVNAVIYPKKEEVKGETKGRKARKKLQK